MSTIDSKKIITDLIKGNGKYYSDPQAYQVSAYTNFAGGVAYHVAYNKECVQSLESSEFVRNVVVLWTLRDGLTEEGKRFLEG